MIKSNINKLMFALILVLLIPVFNSIVSASDDILVEATYYDREIKLLYEELLNFLYENESVGKGIDSSAIAPEFVAFDATISELCNKATALLDKARQLRLRTSTLDSLSITVARAFAFQALAMAEAEKFGMKNLLESAVQNYFASLNQVSENAIPIIYTMLPDGVKIGNKEYDYLADILDDRAQSLRQYSSVTFEFNDRNIFYNFPDLRLIKIDTLNSNLPFSIAQNKFSKEYVLASGSSIKVIIPSGLYVLSASISGSSQNLTFATFFVPKEQQITLSVTYFGNSALVHEIPRSQLIPSEKILSIPQIDGVPLTKYVNNPDSIKGALEKPPNVSKSEVSDRRQGDEGKKTSPQELSTVIETCLLQGLLGFGSDYFGAKVAPTAQAKIINAVASNLMKQVLSGKFYEEFSFWSAAWDVAKGVAAVFSIKGRAIMEICQFVYCVIKNYLLANHY